MAFRSCPMLRLRSLDINLEETTLRLFSTLCLRRAGSALCSSRQNTYFVGRSESTNEVISGYTSACDESETEFDSQELRNVSRLPPNQYKRYHGVPPDATFKDLTHRQQRYARFGAASGEDPRIMWPSLSSLQAMEEEEKEENTQTLTERLAQIQTDQQAADEEKMARRKRIEQNMAQMPKWIKEYEQKHLQADNEAKVRAAKKGVLLEEAREYFGYKIQANDPKFQQMLEEKEEKERAETRKRKKEEKAKKIADRLAQDAAQASKTETKTAS